MIKIEIISYAKLGSKNFEFVIEFYVFNYFNQFPFCSFLDISLASYYYYIMLKSNQLNAFICYLIVE